MNIKNLKKILRKKLINHRRKGYLILPGIIHLIKYFSFAQYRKQRCIIDPPFQFFYKFRKSLNYLSFFLKLFELYFKKKKIFISVNNSHNYSPGHIYAEMDQLQRLQKLDLKYAGSTIWFTTTRKEILGETKSIFENNNFKILFGGIKRILLTFVAVKYPSISIDGSISNTNFFLGKNYSNRFAFNNLAKNRSRLLLKSYNFYPNKDKLKNYQSEMNYLMKKLNISRSYVVIQIKTVKVNGTIKPLDSESLLKSIRYFQDKNYQIVFAGREKFPEIFTNKSIIDYANSKYISSLNDFILIANCSIVISSASGFCFLPESLDKPLLIVNAHHMCQNFGRRTIYIPTLLSRKSVNFNLNLQHRYLCTYGPDCGYEVLDDMYIYHMPTSEEILMGAKELEQMLTDNIPSFSSIQKNICENRSCPLLVNFLSRISENYLINHKKFFEKS